jgi:hypothetical protein
LIWWNKKNLEYFHLTWDSRFLQAVALKGYAIVPYIKGVTEPIKRILSNCNIKVALKPYLTLGHIFAKPKDPVKTCGDCEKKYFHYFGQSKRQFGTRLEEHQKAVSTLDNSRVPQSLCQNSIFIIRRTRTSWIKGAGNLYSNICSFACGTWNDILRMLNHILKRDTLFRPTTVTSHWIDSLNI